MSKISVVGISNNGCLSLSASAMNLVAKAQVLFASERLLAFFGEELACRKICFKSPLAITIQEIIEYSYEHNVCVLASGDPLFYGIGHSLLKSVGSEQLCFHPAPSAFQWAFAKIGVSWEDAVCLSFHGKELLGVVAKLHHGHINKAVILTDEKNSPQVLGRHLDRYGERNIWDLYVAEDLCGKDERIRKLTTEEVADELFSVHSLNLLILIRKRQQQQASKSDSDYFKRKKEMITKKEVRAIALALLELTPDAVCWDIGSGSGSVAISMGKLAYRGSIYAIEKDAEACANILENMITHKCDHLNLICGEAPTNLYFKAWPCPDAIFIGGSGGHLEEIIKDAWARLCLGGRLVITAVVLENIFAIKKQLEHLSNKVEMLTVNISNAHSFGRGTHTRMEAQHPVTIFKITKEEAEKERGGNDERG
ncbi:MAG: precorrin-6y C5,15-methyltransferase (decarboxylating) subunit CbiE [Oligoflexia bacterium]|nr:precorrin-6y C5,15-methyltransferase (decarboxylating) subunit CbiE [Oligoflexia bacterium]